MTSFDWAAPIVKEDATMSTWPGTITAITLFVEDLAATKRFYIDVFGLPVAYEDDASTVFRFGPTMINLLKSTEAVGLIEPATVGDADAGARLQLPSTSTMSTRCAPSSRSAGSCCSTDRWIGHGAFAPPASGIPAATSGRSRTRLAKPVVRWHCPV
jgi:catechol 2,3-dioxygenase-like lactoylglutathione lyase family enzyme